MSYIFSQPYLLQGLSCIFSQPYLLQGLSALDVVYICSVLPVTRTIRFRCGIYFLSLTCYKDYQVQMWYIFPQSYLLQGLSGLDVVYISADERFQMC